MEGIIALDPAGPIYESNSDLTKLGRNDAKAVQVFHTNSNGMFGLGYHPRCGTVDFYFNGAKEQPEGNAHGYGYPFLVALNRKNMLGGSYRDC